jgi:hypothetical protein
MKRNNKIKMKNNILRSVKIPSKNMAIKMRELIKVLDSADIMSFYSYLPGNFYKYSFEKILYMFDIFFPKIRDVPKSLKYTDSGIYLLDGEGFDFKVILTDRIYIFFHMNQKANSSEYNYFEVFFDNMNIENTKCSFIGFHDLLYQFKAVCEHITLYDLYSQFVKKRYSISIKIDALKMKHMIVAEKSEIYSILPESGCIYYYNGLFRILTDAFPHILHLNKIHETKNNLNFPVVVMKEDILLSNLMKIHISISLKNDFVLSFRKNRHTTEYNKIEYYENNVLKDYRIFWFKEDFEHYFLEICQEYNLSELYKVNLFNYFNIDIHNIDIHNIDKKETPKRTRKRVRFV